MPETKRGALLRAAFRESERRMARNANRPLQRELQSEVDEQEVIVGRQREAQLIAEAERHAAARAKGASS